MVMYMELHEKLKGLREDHDMTLKDVAGSKKIFVLFHCPLDGAQFNLGGVKLLSESRTFRSPAPLPAHKAPKRGGLDKRTREGSLAGAPAILKNRTQQNNGFVVMLADQTLPGKFIGGGLVFGRQSWQLIKLPGIEKGIIARTIHLNRKEPGQ